MVSIDYSDDFGSVSVTTSSGNVYMAEHVVVTVPVGVLKAGNITFFPPLPEWKLEAIGKLNMGVLNRIALKFQDVFWPKDQYTFGYVSITRGLWPMIVNQVSSS